MSDTPGKRLASVVDVADNSTTVTARRAQLWGIYVNTALSAHACPIENTAGTAVFTLPASLAAGTMLDFQGAFFDGLVVDPNDVGTGSITVIYTLA